MPLPYIESMGLAGHFGGATEFDFDYSLGFASAPGFQDRTSPFLKPGSWDLTLATTSVTGDPTNDVALEAWFGAEFNGDLFFFGCGPAPDGPFLPIFWPAIQAGPSPDCSVTIQPWTQPGNPCSCDNPLFPFPLFQVIFRMHKFEAGAWAVSAHLHGVWTGP